MRVVGGVWPSMPMRTPFDPSAPTAMWLCPVAITVPGKSTITRAGESAVLSLGVTRAASADLDPDVVRAPDHVHPLQLVSLARR